MNSDKLKIYFVSVEVAPFAKVGGLADVANGLPKALASKGHDVRVIMPAYRMISQNPKFEVRPFIDELKVPINLDWTEKAFVYQTQMDNVPVYLIGSPSFFQKATESTKVYDIEAGADPYLFFDRAVLALTEALSKTWMPDVIHCNDWHTGLIPVYLKNIESIKRKLDGVKTVFTIHNLAYQGDFDRTLLWRAGLPDSLYSVDGLEAYGRVNFLKGGLVFSDATSTVSRNYAKEIQTPEYGCGLYGLLEGLNNDGRLSGIVNGIDYEEFNPATDPRIPFNYSSKSPGNKVKCKEALQKEEKLPIDPEMPLIGMVTRLSDQKGLDILKDACKKILSIPVQFVVLGTGDKSYEEYFTGLQKKASDSFRAHITFDADLAQRIYAASDLFMMASRFEPCGLGQLIALRYGSIPIVRKTGGLADTIIDADEDTKNGNGYIFTQYSSTDLLKTVKRAVKAYHNKEQWNKLVIKALKADMSWDTKADEYVELFRSVLEKNKVAVGSAL